VQYVRRTIDDPIFLDHFKIADDLERTRPAMEGAFMRLRAARTPDEAHEIRTWINAPSAPFYGLRKREAAIRAYWRSFIEHCKPFELVRGRLMFRPPTGPPLEVVRPEDVPDVIRRELSSDDFTGNGAVTVYKKLQYKYAGITRTDVEQVLAGDETHQLTRPITFRTNRPIVAKRPNDLWAIDLVDMSPHVSSDGHRYIVTIVDVYSHMARRHAQCTSWHMGSGVSPARPPRPSRLRSRTYCAKLPQRSRGG
jgi:hypothetical protein